MATMLSIACCFIFGLGIRVHALTQPCQEDFGSDLPNPISEDSSLGLFLNLENRAQCSGTVTAYHYCYYDLSSEDVRIVFFMIFRENGSEYSLVEGSLRRVTRTNAQVNGFGCDEVQLNEDQQFQVQENDIIAACTVEHSDSRPLHVHASSGGGFLYELNGFDTGSLDSCSSAELSTISGLARQDDFALHLYADIEVDAPVTQSSSTGLSVPVITELTVPVTQSSSPELDVSVTQSSSTGLSVPVITELTVPVTQSFSPELIVSVTQSSTHSSSLTVTPVATTSSVQLRELTSPIQLMSSSNSILFPDMSSAFNHSPTATLLSPSHSSSTPSPSMYLEPKTESNSSSEESLALFAGIAAGGVLGLGAAIVVVVVLVVVVMRRRSRYRLEGPDVKANTSYGLAGLAYPVKANPAYGAFRVSGRDDGDRRDGVPQTDRDDYDMVDNPQYGAAVGEQMSTTDVDYEYSYPDCPLPPTAKDHEYSYPELPLPPTARAVDQD